MVINSLGENNMENKVDYKTLPFKIANNSFASVLEAKLLGSELKEEKKDKYEARNLIIRLGLECTFFPSETLSSIELLNRQSSLDSELNPSDFYFAVRTERNEGAHGGEVFLVEHLLFEYPFHISARSLNAKCKIWKEPQFASNENTRHFSFYSGMDFGCHTWVLYKLDYKNINKPSFEFVKRYAYVQGESVLHSDLEAAFNSAVMP